MSELYHHAADPEHEVTITPDGDGMSVSVDQVQPAAGIPSFAKKIVGDEIEILQREEWSSATDATLEVSIPHKPGHLKGTVTLRENGTGTLETVDAEIKVHIPMLGGKLEKLISDLLSSALRSEREHAIRLPAWQDGLSAYLARMVSSTAIPAAQATGLPPYVPPNPPLCTADMMSARPVTAARGSP